MERTDLGLFGQEKVGGVGTQPQHRVVQAAQGSLADGEWGPIASASSALPSLATFRTVTAWWGRRVSLFSNWSTQKGAFFLLVGLKRAFSKISLPRGVPLLNWSVQMACFHLIGPSTGVPFRTGLSKRG